MKKYILLILLPILFYSCKNTSESETAEPVISNYKYEKIRQLEWLLGTWTDNVDDKFSQESWSKENDSTFTAFSFTQVAGETVFAETMALEQKGDRLQLTVADANEKGSLPITFRFISSEDNQFTFENKNHDFPERITYTNPTEDSLHAWIEGTVNNEKKRVDFYFSRKN